VGSGRTCQYGAWEFIKNNLGDEISITHISRPPSGSPATGSSKFHTIQQGKIIDKAFSRCKCPYVNYDCEMACIGNHWQSFEKEIAELNITEISTDLHTGLKPLK